MKKKVKELTIKDFNRIDCRNINCRECPFSYGACCYKENIKNLLTNQPALALFCVNKDEEIEVVEVDLDWYDK